MSSPDRSAKIATAAQISGKSELLAAVYPIVIWIWMFREVLPWPLPEDIGGSF